MKPKTFLTILLAGAILFSAFTLTQPWIRVHPGLSAAMNLGNSVNDLAADALSALSGFVGDLLDGQGTQAAPDPYQGFREALQDEKDLVDILSKGDCTPYDYSRVMVGLCRYFQGDDLLLFFAAQGYGYYAVLLLGLIAFTAAILGRFGWSALYSAGLCIYLSAVYTMTGAVNDQFETTLLSITDGFLMAAAAAALIFFLFICSAFVPAGEKAASGGAGSSSSREDQADEDPWTRAVPDPDQMEEAAAQTKAAPQKKKWKMPKPDAGFIVALVLLVLGIAAAAALYKNRKPAAVSIDLSAYMHAEVSGYDGYGKVQGGFDMDAFCQDLCERMEDQAAKTGSKGPAPEEAGDDARAVAEGLEVSLSGYDHFSNGDSLQAQASLSEEAKAVLERYYITLDTEKLVQPLQVEGLSPILSYNPFQDLEISFEGAEPYGQANVYYYGDYGDALWAEVSPSSGLKNGDPVTITINSDYDGEELKEYYGIELTSTQETAWASGLKYYPGSIEDISGQGIEDIMETARSIAQSNISEEYKSDEQIAGLTPLGQVLAASDADNAQIHNHLFCLFRVSYANTSGDSRSYIYFVGFRDVMTDPDSGELSYNSGSYLVPQKPDFIADTLNMDLNLAEFVVVRFLPPRILSGFDSVDGFYDRYVSPLEDTCTITAGGSELEGLW